MSGMHRNRIKRSPAARKQSRLRLIIQLIAAAFFNGYTAGFFRKTIFTKKSKAFCVPVLNCYSCPGALGSCPIGALQTVIGGNRKFPFYVLGCMMLFGVLLGRLVCGFLCPFGLIQDLLYRIPCRKLHVPKKADRMLRYLKYVILLVFVILLPAFAVNALGTGDPFFCKYICPAGTLEGGIPHVLLNPVLRKAAGVLFTWKTALLAVILASSVCISRFFCRYFCPLGAWYALFHKATFAQMELSKQNCTGCGTCDKVCPMALDVRKQLSGAECIRCGRCRAACPEKAITGAFLCSNQSKSDNSK